MSDDLVNRLRDSCYLAFDDGTNDYAAAHKAADRIEELQARGEAAGAKLAKAVGALHEIAGKKVYADDPWGIARTTLAELKKDE